MHKTHKVHNMHKQAKSVPFGVMRSVLEGVWNGIVVSGVMTVSVYLGKAALDFFLL